MKSYFTYFKGSNDQFYFNLKAANHEIILQSEGYTGKSSCLKGIASVQKNSQIENHYTIKNASNDEYYFTLKASNGEVIGRSETYPQKSTCEKGIAAVKKAGVTTTIKFVEKPDKKKKIKFTVDGENYTTEAHTLTANEILTIAGKNINEYYLIHIKGNDQISYKGEGGKEIKMKNNIKFISVYNGATPVA